MSYHTNSGSTSGSTNTGSTTNTSNTTDTSTTNTTQQNTTISLTTEAVDANLATVQEINYIEYDLIGVNIDSQGIAQDYTFSDRKGGLFNDPSINLNLGDILIIQNLTGGHLIEIRETLSGIVVATQPEDETILEFTPNTPGLSYYTYYCTTHPDTMNGVINVYDPQNVGAGDKTSFNILPRYSGTGSVGNKSYSWGEGSFDSLNVKNFSLSNDLRITGSAFFSNLVSDHVYFNSSIEASTGANLLMGESNPTNTPAANLSPYGDNSQNLHVTFDGRFFAHNIYGDLSIKEPSASWRTIYPNNLFSGPNYCTTRIISTKLTNGNPRLYAQVASSKKEGAIGRFSDDYGENWSSAGSEPASFFHGGPEKTTQAGWSNDIESHDNLLHVYGSSFDMGRSSSEENYTLDINGTNTAYTFTYEDGSSAESPNLLGVSVYDIIIFYNNSYADYPLEVVDPNGNLTGSTDTSGKTILQPTFAGTYTYRSPISGVTGGSIFVSEESFPIVSYDQLYKDVIYHDSNVYASNVSNVLSGYHAWSQLLLKDNIWDSSNSGDPSVFSLTAEECKYFDFIIDDSWIGEIESTDSFGWASGGSANFQYPNLVCDSRSDLIFGSQTTFPETNTLYALFKGANKLFNHKTENGGTIDPAWVASQPLNSFRAYLTTKHAICDTNFRFEPGVSDDHLIYIGHHFIPTSLFEESFIEISHANDFSTPGSKSFNCNDFAQFGFDYGNLRDFKYVNDSTWSCVNIKTGEIYLLNTALASASLLLEELDGSDWATSKRASFFSSFEKYKNTVIVNGLSTDLPSGEEANTNAFGVNEIDYYLHDSSIGNIVGIGNKGWASLRNLSLDKYNSLSDVWENTTSNGFSPPSFSSFSAYHSASDTLTCGFAGVLNFNLPSVSASIDNTWDSGRFTNQAFDYLRDFRYDDTVTKFFSFSNENSKGLHSTTHSGWNAITNKSLCDKYSISLRQASSKLTQDHYTHPVGYSKSLPGHEFSISTGFGQGLSQNFIRMPDESVLYTTHGITNSDNPNRNAWHGHNHLTLYRFENDSFENLLQSRVISYNGYSNGHFYSYGKSAFTLNNNLTTNVFRTDFNTHPYSPTIDLLPGVIDIESLPEDSETKWFDGTSVSRNFGVFYASEQCNAIFSDYNGLNPEDGRWSFLLEIKNLNTKKNFISPQNITLTKNIDETKFALSFSLPDSSYGQISDYLTAIGLTTEEIDQCTTVVDTTNNIREVELWISVVEINSSGDYVQQYKKMIRMRDSSSTAWKDEPLPWENKQSIKSFGNFGFIFGEDISQCSSFQMPNQDVILMYGNDWYICSVNGFVAGGDYINSPNFANNIANNINGPIYTVDLVDGPNKPQQAYPDTILCAINDNAVLARMKTGGQYFLGYIQTDGQGSVVSVREVFDPSGGPTSNTNVKSFSTNNTTYFISEGRVWYADSDEISFNAATSSTIIPTWTEITTEETLLSSVNGVGYHAGSESFYLLSDNGLYCKSYSGTNNWGIDFKPQYSFATQNQTGLYKDLSHNLHMVRDGDILLSATQSGASCKSLSIKSSNPEEITTENALYNDNGSLFWSGDLISSGQRVLFNQDSNVNEDIVLDVEAGRSVFILLHFNGYIDQLNFDTSGEFKVSSNSEELASSVFIDIPEADVNNIFYLNPSISFIVGDITTQYTQLTINCLINNLISVDGTFKITAYYI